MLNLNKSSLAVLGIILFVVIFICLGYAVSGSLIARGPYRRRYFNSNNHHFNNEFFSILYVKINIKTY